MFYSNDLFKGDSKGVDGEKAARTGTIIFGTVNMATALCSTFLLGLYGRKTLMLLGQFAMGIALGLFALFVLLKLTTTI